MPLTIITTPSAPQQACIWILKESRSIYRAVSEGIMNLADKFFEMERGDALQVGARCWGWPCCWAAAGPRAARLQGV